MMYGVIPYPCPQCMKENLDDQTAPNGSAVADTLVDRIASTITNILTDPSFGGWYDDSSPERVEAGDKCAFMYDGIKATGGQRQWNIQLGVKKYLLSQPWVATSSGSGYCQAY